MSVGKPSDPFKRHKTRFRGITYRERLDGSRQFFVYAQGKQIPVEGGERDALTKQAELRGRMARGEQVAPAKKRFGEVADEWLATKRRLRPKTLAGYRSALKCHLLPYFGELRIGHVTEDRVAAFVADMERKTKRTRKNATNVPAPTLKGWTVQGALTPLSGIMAHAVRKGYVARNPVTLLTRDERPEKNERPKRILEPDEIDRLLAAAPEKYRPIIATAIYTGLRLGELLGLRWADVDFAQGVVNVRGQVTQAGGRVEYGKTENALREVVLAPEVARMLAEHRLRSSFSGDEDFVFASGAGTPLHYRNVERRGMDEAVARAGLAGEAKLVFHQLRHTYASMLIAQGLDPAQVCSQMGHANPAITLRIYTHLFDRRNSREKIRAAVGRAIGKSLASADGNAPENAATSGGAEPAALQEIRDAREAVGTP
jgi:integrase